MAGKFLAIALFFSAHLSADIIETAHMEEILPQVKSGMLVIFDVDNTLIEPVQELGSDQWFEHRIKEYISYGYAKDAALEKALREWTAIQSITNIKTVEGGTSEIIHKIQQQGVSVMGLTTRGLGLSTRTVEQLHTVGIDLGATAPIQEEIFFMNEKGVLFRGGTLFTAGTHKGNALRKFLKRINYTPDSILFVDDKISHLMAVESLCEDLGIPFIGYRYGRLDDKVHNLRKQIADVQFHFFGHILSDEAAERILHER